MKIDWTIEILVTIFGVSCKRSNMRLQLLQRILKLLKPDTLLIKGFGFFLKTILKDVIFGESTFTVCHLLVKLILRENIT